MAPNLFRQAQNGLERLVHTDNDDVVLQQSRVWARGITWALIGVTGFGLAWLALAKTEEIVTAPGKLEPLGVVKDIQMPVGGVVDEVLVKEGDQVRKGQVLLRLDTVTSRDRQQSILKTIAFKQQQLRLKREELVRYLAVNDTEQQVLVERLGLEREVLGRLETLNRQGAVQELQYLSPGDPALPNLCVRVLAALLAQEPRFESPQADPAFRTVALVGPTGVGKTTTLAKLAARACKRGQDIAIVTVDTYRVAAVEQLRAFADLLNVPMEVAFTPQDLRRTLHKFADKDRIYIDTTGRSPLDRDALQAAHAALPDQDIARLLCLPAAARRKDALCVIDAHDRAGIQGVCITKWDETTQPGEALSAAVERGLKLSHVTVGQEVPADIAVADALELARAAFAVGQETRR